MAVVPLSITDADLEAMRDDELAVLEDQLLVDNELDLSKNARFTAGRAVVWVLTIIGVVIALFLYSRLPTRNLGPLNIPLYLIALGVGAAAAHRLWGVAGRHVRGGIRLLLNYWPVLLFLGVRLFILVKGEG